MDEWKLWSNSEPWEASDLDMVKLGGSSVSTCDDDISNGGEDSSPLTVVEMTRREINCDTVEEVKVHTSFNRGAQAMIKANKAIRESGRPNFRSCRVPVSSKLNLEFWRTELEHYHDKEVLDFFTYGCPISYTGDPFSRSQCGNHKGATDYADDIDAYLQREINEGAVWGPFLKSPFDSSFVVSPLNSCPKKDSRERRVIVDLSYPKLDPSRSVNGGIDKYSYLGESIRLRYPSVDDLAKLVREKGRGCALFKRDLRRAYRQFPVDPGDVHLLGYRWKNQLIFDCTLTMGLRSAAYLCQRYTNAIRYIAKNKGFSIINYLDDLAGAESWDRASDAYVGLAEILSNAGLQESTNKACPPSCRMEFLGVTVDTQGMTLEVSTDRLQELDKLLQLWVQKVEASKRELQSLIGTLQFVAACVKPGRIFMSRILNLLRVSPEQGSTVMDEDLRQDIRWWQKFLRTYNGVSIIPELGWSEPDEFISCDACLQGAGGWFCGRYFHKEFPPFIRDMGLHINALEFLTVLVAFKIWGRHLTAKKVVLYCDNWTVVVVSRTGRARDKFLQSCLRELVYLQARHNFQARFQHVAGTENRIADLLSRWEISEGHRQEFYEKWGCQITEETFVYDGNFEFSHDW